MQFDITVLPGDGIGPEVISEGIKVLEAIGERFGHDFNFYYQLIGGLAIDKTGSALPQATLDACRESDAVLKGPVGGPKWDDPKAKVHPEDGLLALRGGLGL
jgi:3-isopropylmalate dehydrogenase